jgi:Tol biopolymer transport system component
MRADGTQRTQLTAVGGAEHHWPRPNRDGSRILYYRADPGQGVNDIGTNSLWVMNGDGTGQRQLIPRGAYGWTRQAHVEWSPDGQRLLMSAGSDSDLQLWTTDAEGGDPRKLTDRRTVFGGPNVALDPSWAPDGRHVAFVGCPQDLLFCFPWNYEVFRLDTVTGVETRLTDDGIADFDPYVSPDGGTVVWLRCSGSFPAGPWGLYRRPWSGTGSASVVLDDGNVNSNANWSHDGQWLLFHRTVLGGPPHMTTARIRPDGTGLSLVGGGYASHDEGGSAYWP